MLENTLKFFIAIIGSIGLFMFGEWSTFLGILVGLVVLDYITGIITGWLKGELCSEYGRKGIAKKVFIFAIVSVAHIADVLIGNDPFIREATIIFYIINELISIIENAGKAGVPLPKKLKKAVEALKETKGQQFKK